MVEVPEQRAIISGIGMTLIVLACTLLGSATPYPGTAALLPVLGAMLLIGRSGCDRSYQEARSQKT